MSDLEQQAAFGRKIAAAQGYSPNDPSIDYAAYGRAATYHLGRRQGVPNPAEFRTGPEPVAVPSTGAAKQRHVIRIGRVEMSLADAPRASNRPQRPHHRGQRTVGYYRRGEQPWHCVWMIRHDRGQGGGGFGGSRYYYTRCREYEVGDSGYCAKHKAMGERAEQKAERVRVMHRRDTGRARRRAPVHHHKH